MKKQEFTTNEKTASWSYLWLILGMAFQLFSNGKWIVPIASWLYIVFIVRFLRVNKPVRGILIGISASIIVSYFTYDGIIPLNGSLFYIVVGGMVATSFLPFIADRLISPRIKGFASTLVLPLAWTTVEYISSLLNPYGTWSSLAYTQYGNLPLMQIVSITGIWGIIFLMTWFVSVINFAWQQNWEWVKIRNAVLVYSCIFLAVICYGGARLNVLSPKPDTVRIATLTTPHEYTERASKVDLSKIYKESPEKFRTTILDLTSGESYMGGSIYYCGCCQKV